MYNIPLESVRRVVICRFVIIDRVEPFDNSVWYLLLNSIFPLELRAFLTNDYDRVKMKLLDVVSDFDSDEGLS